MDFRKIAYHRPGSWRGLQSRHDCPLGTQTATLTLNKTNYTYGDTITPTVTVSSGWTTANGFAAPPITSEVIYVNQSGTADYNSSIAPSNVGSYTAQLRFDTDKTASVNFTIVSADSTVTKVPAAKTLTFTGSVQELVTAGSASGGELQYAIGENADNAPTSGWSTSISTATNAGT